MADEELIQSKLPCPDQETCQSSNAFAIFADGHGHCFSGNHPQETRTYSAKRLEEMGYEFRLEGSSVDGVQRGTSAVPASSRAITSDQADLQRTLEKFQFKALGSRKITLATCKRIGYRVGVHPKSKHKVELCPVHDLKGSLIGIKVRDTGVDGLDKEFTKFGGDISKALIGLHRWGPAHKRNDGKPTFIVIVEGEHDYAAVDQAMEGRHPVCSLPQGVNSAVGAIKANLQTLLTYDRVVLGFDQDEAGRAAMEECYDLFPPGKVWTAQWPLKDASDLMQADRSVDITRLVWQPRPYRPDGVVDGRDLTEECLGEVQIGIPWPHRFMTGWTYGRRHGELYTFGSGTGMGKSDEIAEVICSTIFGITKYGERYAPEAVCVFNWEAGAATTKKTIAGKRGKKRFHIPNGPELDGFEWTKDELRETLREMDVDAWSAGGKLFINDSRGSAEWETVKNRCRYLRAAEDVRHFVFDPLGALVAGEDDERKALDKIVLEAAALMVELDACGYIVSHLTRPSQGESHEEGGQVKLSQFRGSNGIGMYSNFVFGMERNQQADTDEERCETTFRVVKDRFTGNSTGKTAKTHYDRFTGSLDEPLSNKDTQL